MTTEGSTADIAGAKSDPSGHPSPVAAPGVIRALSGADAEVQVGFHWVFGAAGVLVRVSQIAQQVTLFHLTFADLPTAGAEVAVEGIEIRLGRSTITNQP